MKKKGKKADWPAVAIARKFAKAGSIQRGTGHVEGFNVREVAYHIGLQFSEFAKQMDSIYGEDRFVISKDLKHWAAAFMRGDCDEPIAGGDRKVMLDTDCGMAIAAIASALAQGADIEGALTAIGKKLDDLIDPATGTFRPGLPEPEHWEQERADMTPFIYKK